MNSQLSFFAVPSLYWLIFYETTKCHCISNRNVEFRSFCFYCTGRRLLSRIFFIDEGVSIPQTDMMFSPV